MKQELWQKKQCIVAQERAAKLCFCAKGYLFFCFSNQGRIINAVFYLGLHTTIEYVLLNATNTHINFITYRPQIDYTYALEATSITNE